MGLLVAYIAGLLSFFAPCGTFLLPGFFAYAFDGRFKRVAATWAFLAGFATLFVPIGLGAYVLGAQLALHRRELAWVGGVFMLALAPFALFGRGLSIPTPTVLTPVGRNPRLPFAAYFLGLAFGFTIAGCSAPLLAITLALAGSSQSFVSATLLLCAYVVGLGTPLLMLAAATDRGHVQARLAWMQRAHTLRIGTLTLQLRSANIIAAVVLAAMGVVFIVSQGTFFLGTLARFPMFLDFNIGAAEKLSGWLR